MIYTGSCDTEEKNNGCWNSALPKWYSHGQADPFDRPFKSNLCTLLNKCFTPKHVGHNYSHIHIF